MTVLFNVLSVKNNNNRSRHSTLDVFKKESKKIHFKSDRDYFRAMTDVSAAAAVDAAPCTSHRILKCIPLGQVYLFYYLTMQSDTVQPL